MAQPGRNSSQEEILNPLRTFFATANASMGKNLFQSDRNAGLFIEVLRELMAERKFELHDFVVMPDHVHLLLSVDEGMTIERAMQFVKGRFSFRLKKEFGYSGEVWQRGFSEVQVIGSKSFETHRRYVAENPVKAGLASSVDQFPFCYRSLAKRKAEEKAGRG
jgi:putative transposase